MSHSARALTLGVAITLVGGTVASIMLRSSGAGAPTPRAAGDVRSHEAIAKVPLAFIENRGQVDDRASYYLQGSGASAYFTPDGIALSVDAAGGTATPSDLALEFPGARAVQPTAHGKTETVVSTFTDESSEAGLHAYSRVAYPELWPGVDLVFSGNASQLKYRFEVRPGADPDAVQMAWQGTEALRVNEAGQLELVTASGTVIDDTPRSYQYVDGARVEVPTTYAVGSDGRVGFDLGAYDPARPLVIDPALLIFASYLGGDQSEEGRGIAVDSSGSAYVSGRTSSTQTTFPDGDPNTNDAMPSPGLDQSHNGGTDAFVAKLNPAGTALVYVTYIGGGATEAGRGIAVDASGNAYLTGFTSSPQGSFPDGDGFGGVPGFDQTHNGNEDVFVVKIAPAGTALVYATYIGGTSGERGQRVTVDASGNAYVVGYTSSDQTTFPDGDGFGGITGPDQTYNGATDAFIAKVAPAGTSLAYAGYIGGGGSDLAFGVGVEGSGRVHLAGWTDSDQTTFPDGTDTGGNGEAFDGIPGPDQTQNGDSDAFVATVTATGALSSAGYIGGANPDWGFSLALDAAGNSYVGGQTASDQTTFPDGTDTGANGDAFDGISGPDQTYNGSGDAFVAKLSNASSTLAYAGYVGGASFDSGYGIASDASGNAYLVGETTSDQTSFPDGTDSGANGEAFDGIPGPDQTHNGGSYDAFVAKVHAGGTVLVSAGYIGEGNLDNAYDIAVDAGRNAYVTGRTQSDQATFPDGDGFGGIPGFDQSYNGTEDVFVAKVEAFPVISCKGQTATIVGSDLADTLTGTEGADVIVGLGGADTIAGAGGNDLICGGDGNDGLDGGGGNDTLHGEEGDDSGKGGAGNDVLSGLAGNDTLSGNAGKDTAKGEAGNDRVKGQAGNDKLSGGKGNDTGAGGGGKDKVRGQAGKDKLKGGGGNDKVSGGPGKDTCAGGAGKDKAPACEVEKSIP